jgi:hypothetical protein
MKNITEIHQRHRDLKVDATDLEPLVLGDLAISRSVSLLSLLAPRWASSATQ